MSGFGSTAAVPKKGRHKSAISDGYGFSPAVLATLMADERERAIVAVARAINIHRLFSPPRTP